ncbi:hypothetical protein HF319_03870 [Xanthomonas sp. Kuri4-1]
MNNGDMSREEFTDRSEARAAGAVIGLALVTVGRTLMPAVPVATKVAIKEVKQEIREERKQRNKPPGPDPAAEGRPHSRIERPGSDGQYTTHNGDGTYSQYRGSGRDHGDIPRPNVKETKLNTAPDGKQYVGKPEVRQPRLDEIPRGR